jgi:signal transduction histidine kinase
MITQHLPQAIVPVRLTVRLRLTLLYGGLFLAAGAVLLTITYALVRRWSPGMRWPPGTEWLVLGTASPAAREAQNVQHLIAEGRFPGMIRQVIPTPPEVVAQLNAAEAHGLLTAFVIALAIMTVIAAGLGWLVAGRVLRPLQVMATTARRLTEQNLGERFNLPGPRDELTDLADVFDTMLDRLQAAFDRERRFAASASHELRTPLATKQALLDVGLADARASLASLREMGERVRRVNHRNIAVVEGLLALAGSEQGIHAREPVNLATVAADAIDAAKPEAAAVGVHIQARLSPATVTGDRAFLDRLAGNLIENAIRHNHQGGQAEIVTSARDGHATLTVTNTGPPITLAEIPALFEPFRRGATPKARSRQQGTGLGLSIVKAIVAAHHGTIDTQALPQGGLSITVSFSAAQPQSPPAHPGSMPNNQHG